MSNDPDDAHFERLLEYVRQSRGFDFSGYKRPSLMRRVSRRMHQVGMMSFEAYLDYLLVHPDEFARLFDNILINVTAFFRDAAAWEVVRSEVVPQILGAKQPDEPVRIWSAGCASGEEAISLAIVFAEAMGIAQFKARVKIYATDADEGALNEARVASYSTRHLEDLDPALRERYFEPAGERAVFRQDLRRCLIFGRHDLVQDAPISWLDLLACRNTLMYFNAESQARVLAKLHFALNGEGDGAGFLFLGRAETLLSHGNLFSPVDLKCRVFRKVAETGARHRTAPQPAAKADGGDMRRTRLREQAMEEAPLARVVVDADGILVLANQRARSFFSINPRDVGRPIQDLEIFYRPVELRSLIEQAYVDRRSVTQTSVERHFPGGEPQHLDVVVSPFFDERNLPSGVAVSFIDATRICQLQDELRRSRDEAQTANEELQAANDELETTNEELQSSNEELKTANEELQLTNEELETMNEELQSTNEELQTVNEVLYQRTGELQAANAFLESVLGSLHSGAVVLNEKLEILRWNKRAEDLWGLRADEMGGRSLLDLDIGLPISELVGAIQPCLEGEATHRELVLGTVNGRGTTVGCRVACVPPISSSQKRGGIVLLMDEVDALSSRL